MLTYSSPFGEHHIEDQPEHIKELFHTLVVLQKERRAWRATSWWRKLFTEFDISQEHAVMEELEEYFARERATTKGDRQ